MKRLLSLFLTIIMVVTTMSACGNSDTSDFFSVDSSLMYAFRYSAFSASVNASTEVTPFILLSRPLLPIAICLYSRCGLSLESIECRQLLC